MGATRTSRQGRAQKAEGTGGTDLELLQGAVEVDLGAGIEALRKATERFTSLVRNIEDPTARTRGLDWSLADTAAHVLLTVRYDLGTLQGTRQPYAVIDGDILRSGTLHNAEMLRSEPERDPGKLADLIDEAIEEFIVEAQRHDPRDSAPLAGGKAMTVANLVGTILGEVILHGYDIARTIGTQMQIDPGAARLAVYATTATLPLAVDERATADLDVRLEMRIRGGEAFVVHIDYGAARTEPTGARADFYMSSDPLAYLLVGFGRSGPLRQVLRGKMISWGRRPSLALKLPTFFRKP
ncbi:MAG: maleylpyruvate isomerase N-terminal domain-containing protein [Actinomycetota bacterium]|nr:maleylpyruvate isomerase N-terminal domain-containing protein [Actinomycetota bacterium]